MEVPLNVQSTLLAKRLSEDESLQSAVLALREIAAEIGKCIAVVMPEYTDHSLRHMDALWGVTDAVLTEAEVQKFSVAEAFVLAASFYLHDLGMGLAATRSGLDAIRATPTYVAELSRLRAIPEVGFERAATLATRLAARALHAENCVKLATERIPGLDRYLIENTNVREAWAYMIGRVSASHHWSIETLDQELGQQGCVPAPSGEIDLGYVASVLRLVDFAHINRERASHLERALRSEISRESIRHWDAQASICGPRREGSLLVYASTSPIDDIDAWYLFYELATGLDSEIGSVRDYLQARSVSIDRLSLEGVKGIESADRFASLVHIGGNVSPVDVQIRPHSIGRLVELLGGATLYGSDRMAALRELMQNARDAIELRRTQISPEQRAEFVGKIEVRLIERDGRAVLSVADDGVGMSSKILTEYLIGIASDYWQSGDYHREFPAASRGGFSPVGRFGIGFLSVFMLGERITVETERAGCERLELRLRGVGRRGELRKLPPQGRTGTEVQVQLNSNIAQRLSGSLLDIVRSRAPMLTIPIEVQDGTAPGGPVRIEPGWWQCAGVGELRELVTKWDRRAWGLTDEERGTLMHGMRRRGLYWGSVWAGNTSEDRFAVWPGVKPECVGSDIRVIACDAELESVVLLCSRGFAIGIRGVHAVFGVADLGDVNLDAARRGLVDRDASNALEAAEESWIDKLRQRVSLELSSLEEYGMLPARLRFINRIVRVYGELVLRNAPLPWIASIEAPGNTIYRGRKEVVARVAAENEVFVGVNLGATGAYTRMARECGDNDEASCILALLVPIKLFEVSYSMRRKLEREDQNGPLIGTFQSLLNSAGLERHDLALLLELVQILAESWGIGLERLLSCDWTLEVGAETIWALLRRDNESRRS